MEKLLNKLIIPYDKALHALYGLILYSLLCFVVQPVIALVTAIVVAAAKELYDYLNQDKHTVDVMDVVATVAVPVMLFIFSWVIKFLPIKF